MTGVLAKVMHAVPNVGSVTSDEGVVSCLIVWPPLYIATLQDAVSIKIKDIHKTVVFSLPCNNGISGVVGTESSQESSSYDARAAHGITGERKKEVPIYNLF